MKVLNSAAPTVFVLWNPRRLSENGYFSQSLRQTQIIILEILQCIPVVIVFAFLDLEKTISFSDNLLGAAKYQEIRSCPLTH
jgi:hypothetical protein